MLGGCAGPPKGEVACDRYVPMLTYNILVFMHAVQVACGTVLVPAAPQMHGLQ